jgi:hypothetical protein
MNKYIIFTLVFLVLAFSVNAQVSTQYSAPCNGNVIVHVVDSNNNPLSGVVVAPEWKFKFTGWNDFYPKEGITGIDGTIKNCNWIMLQGISLQVNYAKLDGYTCTHGTSTKITSVKGQNTLQVVCTPNNTVPEFGLGAGIVTLIGILIGVVIMRKRD